MTTYTYMMDTMAVNVFNQFENSLASMDVSAWKENDSIGFYEYGSKTEYDAQQDYLVCELPDIVSIPITYSERLAYKVMEYLSGETDIVKTVSYDNKTFEFTGKVSMIVMANHQLYFYLKWDTDAITIDIH